MYVSFWKRLDVETVVLRLLRVFDRLRTIMGKDSSC